MLIGGHSKSMFAQIDPPPPTPCSLLFVFGQPQPPPPPSPVRTLNFFTPSPPKELKKT